MFCSRRPKPPRRTFCLGAVLPTQRSEPPPASCLETNYPGPLSSFPFRRPGPSDSHWSPNLQNAAVGTTPRALLFRRDWPSPRVDSSATSAKHRDAVSQTGRPRSLPCPEILPPMRARRGSAPRPRRRRVVGPFEAGSPPRRGIPNRRIFGRPYSGAGRTRRMGGDGIWVRRAMTTEFFNDGTGRRW